MNFLIEALFNWNTQSQDPSAMTLFALQLVTKLSMLDRGKCQVDWRLRGSIAVFPIDIDFASEFGLDLITGRVNAHSERWDLSR